MFEPPKVTARAANSTPVACRTHTDVQARVDAALAAITRGEMVVVADDRSRENEADLIMDAAHMDDARMAFFLRHGSGIVCAPMSDARADELDLPPMVAENTDTHHTAFTITVDHMSVSTGISAHDRAATMRALADTSTVPGDLHRPGHVFPLRARAGGVLSRTGHTEAAFDLVRLASGSPVSVITELVGEDGVPLDGIRARDFAADHGLVYLEIADLVQFRQQTQRDVTRIADARMPTEFGDFRALAYRNEHDDVEHLVLVMGDLEAAGRGPDGVLVRVHSECLTGEVFSSRRCDCGPQLDQALKMISEEGVGVFIYLRGHEGRGIGLGHKLRAYALQDQGWDTVDANAELGLPVDDRAYGAAAAMLADLGVHRIRLATNNPEKYDALNGFGITLLGRVHTPAALTSENLTYLRTKRDRMGHLLELPEISPSHAAGALAATPTDEAQRPA